MNIDKHEKKMLDEEYANKKAGRPSEYEEIEDSLYDWIIKMISLKKPVTTTVLFFLIKSNLKN